MCPQRVRATAYHRLFNPLPAGFDDLFEAAPLREAPATRLRLHSGDVMHGQIALFGEYEPDLTQLVLTNARRGGHFVDVGANAGYFSVLWASARPGNTVTAVEAAPRNVPLLRHNVDSNGMSGQIQVHAVAVGREAGTLSFDPGPDEQTGWGGLALHQTDRTVSVEVVAVDSLVHGRVDLMKVDVEGAELWVFEGARDLLRERAIRQIVFEDNRTRSAALGISDGEAARMLESVGYQVRALGEDMFLARAPA